MIDYSLLKLIPAEESHSEFSFQIKRVAYGDYIKELWGWDEERQIEFHARDWQNKRPQIILYDNQPIGTIYINQNKDCIEIAQFILLPEYQNKGIGTYILKSILDQADRSGLITKLDYLHSNPAASLYERFDFKIVRSDDYFHFAERKPGGKE